MDAFAQKIILGLPHGPKVLLGMPPPTGILYTAAERILFHW